MFGFININSLLTDITDWFTGFGDNSLLPSPDFPVVFHDVDGFTQTDDDNR